MQRSPKKRLNHVFFYSLLATVYFFLPGSVIPFNDHWLSDTLAGLIIYFFFAWFLLKGLGACPLRWRRLAGWVLLIIVAYAYWIEFLQSLLDIIERKSSYYHLLAAVAGGLSGIIVRLNYTYNHCNCSLMHHHSKSDFSPLNDSIVSANSPHTSATKQAPVNATITTIADHPQLNKIIAQAMGWKALTLHPAKDIAIQMVCTGKSLVSLPHFSYGSIKTSKPIENFNELTRLMSAYALPRNIAQMELRQASLDATLQSYKTASWLKLEHSMDVQMMKFSPNLRRKIRKAQKSGFIVKQGGTEFLRDFWNIYARHMDKLGSAALPISYYESMMQNYKEGITSIFLMYEQNKLIGAAFNLAYKGFYENDCFATLHSVQKKYASYLLHYHMINHAILLGCNTYSFGRSTTGGGVHQFKKQWGAADVPLIWAHYPNQKLNIRKQGWLQKTWRLMPWQLRSRLNPYLAKWFY